MTKNLIRANQSNPPALSGVVIELCRNVEVWSLSGVEVFNPRAIAFCLFHHSTIPFSIIPFASFRPCGFPFLTSHFSLFLFHQRAINHG